MQWLGDDGVGAFGVACYYCPFLFMIGNAIAQSAQPIISYNYGQNQRDRVRKTERLAILTALIGGVLVTTGYFQSVEKVWPSIVFALLCGIVFLVPSFLIMPRLLGIPGIWLSLAMSEMLTALTITIYYSLRKRRLPRIVD